MFVLERCGVPGWRRIMWCCCSCGGGEAGDYIFLECSFDGFGFSVSEHGVKIVDVVVLIELFFAVVLI